MTRGNWILVAALACAMILRGVGIDWGIPGVGHKWPYHPDESNFPLALIAFRNALPLPSFHPFDLAWGGFFFGMYGIWTLVGAALGVFSIRDLSNADISSLRNFYLWGRYLTVVVGVLSVYWTYRVSRSIGMARSHAAASALLFALMPYPALHGHYLTVHTLTTFVLLLFSEGVVRESRNNAPWPWPTLAIVAAFLASCEYTYGIAIPIVALLLWRTRGPSCAIRSFVVAAVVWSFLNFGIIFDFSGWRAAQRSQSHFIKWFGVGPIDWVGIVSPSVGVVAFSAGLIGVVVLLRRPTSRPLALWMILVAAAELSLGSPFARRYAPLYPLFAVSAVTWLDSKRSIIGKFVVVIALVECALRAVSVTSALYTADTRTVAQAWIDRNVPVDATVGVENWFFSPHIDVRRYRAVLGRAETRPQWYVATEFNWHEPETLNRYGYTLAEKFRMSHKIFNDRHWPEDLRYVNPTIYVYRLSASADTEQMSNPSVSDASADQVR